MPGKNPRKLSVQIPQIFFIGGALRREDKWGGVLSRAGLSALNLIIQPQNRQNNRGEK